MAGARKKLCPRCRRRAASPGRWLCCHCRQDARGRVLLRGVVRGYEGPRADPPHGRERARRVRAYAAWVAAHPGRPLDYAAALAAAGEGEGQGAA